MPKLREILFGKRQKIQQAPKFDPQTEQLFRQLQQQIAPLIQQQGQYFQDLLSPDSQAYENFAAPYQRQFEEQIIPNIAERFTGSKDSSAFTQALGSAGASLAENLAALREGQRFQAAQGVSPIIGQGLTSTSTPYLQGGTEGILQQLLGPLLQGITGGLSGPLANEAVNRLLNYLRGGQ